jgi:hypothetical protein
MKMNSSCLVTSSAALCDIDGDGGMMPRGVCEGEGDGLNEFEGILSTEPAIPPR